VRYCRLATAPLVDAAAWIERHRAFWSGQLDALGDYLDREDNSCDPPPKAGRPE
jgi:hypothetical protein